MTAQNCTCERSHGATVCALIAGLMCGRIPGTGAQVAHIPALGGLKFPDGDALDG